MGPVLSPQRHFFNVRNCLISSLQFFLMEGNPIASRWSARVAHWWIWQYWWAFNWCFLFVLCPCLSQTPFKGCEGVKQCWLFCSEVLEFVIIGLSNHQAGLLSLLLSCRGWSSSCLLLSVSPSADINDQLQKLAGAESQSSRFGLRHAQRKG